MRKSLIIAVQLLFLTKVALCMDSVDIGPLIQTQWGQRGLYAQFTPKHQRLGCWSVAFAQILYYHKVQPSGTVEYEGNGYSISETLDHAFHWDIFVNSLSQSTPKASQDEVARYCYYAAIVIGKEFNPDEAYKGNSDYRRKGIHEHYSCQTRGYRNYREGHEAVKNAILTELTESRPLLLYVEGEEGLSHAFVIDGVCIVNDEFKVHLNSGWYGNDDGWYDFAKSFKTSLGIFDNPRRWVLAIQPPKQDADDEQKQDR